MDILPQELTIYSLLQVCCVAFAFLVVILFGVRIFRVAHKRYFESFFAADKAKVDEFLLSYDLDIAKRISSRNRYLKNYLKDLADAVDGDVTERLLDLYIVLGYLHQDLARIESWWYFRRVDALTHLRAFQYRLTDRHWDKLLTETRWEFRWATMEYYVSVKGKHSLNRLVAFLSAKKNIYQGNLHHLLAHFASINAESIAYLLRFSDDDRLREALLRTLSIYPVPGSENAIRSSFNFMSSPSVIIAGLAALEVHPESENYDFLKQFSLHEDWQVRSLLAKNLRHYTRSVDMLEKLSIDGSFEVRTHVAGSLAELLPYSGRVVADILAEDNHPSHYFIKLHNIEVPTMVA